MQNSSPHEFESRYRHVISRSRRRLEQMLDRFGESLYDWLSAALNRPEEDWQADLANFVAHSRMTGIELSEESLEQIRGLVEARVNGTGVFATGSQRGNVRVKPTIQLAALALAPDSATDATIDLSESPQEEVAGPGPETSEAFKSKVRTMLELLDPFVAGIWKQFQGTVRVRDPNLLQFSYYSERNKKQLVIVVSPHFTVRDTATAILQEAYTSFSHFFSSSTNPIHSEVAEKKLLTDKEMAKRLAEIQTEAFKQAAATAAFLAESYYGAIASLTPGGDLIVTIDDVDRNGLNWNHLLSALPLRAVFRKAIKRLILKLPGGKTLEFPGQLLDKLNAMLPGKRKELIAKAQKAKTKEEALAIIEKGLDSKPKPVPEKPKRPAPPVPKKGPGRWIKIIEGTEQSRKYESQITGHVNEAYYVDTVKFDGFKNGKLIEAKGPGLAKFLVSESKFQVWWEGAEKTLDQAKSQSSAARGASIEWHVAEAEFAAALKTIFAKHNLPIVVVHTPFVP
jgi:hypothetical protein